MRSSTPVTSDWDRRMSNVECRMSISNAAQGIAVDRRRLFAIRHSPFGIACLLFAMLVASGCSQVPNQWVEDGPATVEDLESPTARDLRAKYEPAPQRHRAWQAASAAAERGAVTHWPLYFEDPFVDKGDGRKGMNKYHIGWEDYVALPYCYARFTLNWLMAPVSAAVTPPWTLMESDGRLSRQLLGYDHDATRAGR
jgi:hypothetical protein